MPLALLLALAADPPQPAWQGVWQGTVGTLPVRACLIRDDYSHSFYYYLGRLRPILLEQQGGSRLWLEDAGAPRKTARPQWRFQMVAAIS